MKLGSISLSSSLSFPLGEYFGKDEGELLGLFVE
jgi:hypothetical protein